MSPQQFLAWEERQPQRYEFDGFQPDWVTDILAGTDAVLRLPESASRSRWRRSMPMSD
jgi:hypothetical protein